MKLTRFLAMLAVPYVLLMSALFAHNLPTWCENPERPGNAMIVGLCK